MGKVSNRSAKGSGSAIKAIILAGGAGTRLRPLSLLRPKPMTRLFDKPLLEHIVILLREQGFDEICMTLQYLPQSVRDWFGDGEEFGVAILYKNEDKPLGTAGGVKACEAFIGGDDVLIISGDAACDLPLDGFAAFHRERDADVSILVRQSAEQMEYGLVLTGADHRVKGFLEKPSADRVYTDLVNTGIYCLSPRVLEAIPPGEACDFGAELFPRLLAEGKRICAWEASGYWNDVGSCGAYLQTAFDALDGKLRLRIPPGRSIPCIPPCYVAPGAVVEPGAVLGPYAVVGAGSSVAAGCKVEHSVLDGAVLERDVCVTGSILCQGVFLGAGCQVREGSVLADGVSVGAGSLIGAGVRIWPGKTVERGVAVLRDIAGEQKPLRPVFGGDGRLRGEAGTELTPEALLRLGAAKGSFRRCGAAGGGGAYASLLASSFLNGCGGAGREAYRLDAETPATAAWAAPRFGLDLSLFVQQEGSRLTLYFFDEDGLPISRKSQRALEAAFSGESEAALPRQCQAVRPLGGTEEAHLAAAAECCCKLEGFRLSVTGGKLLRKALQRRGAALVQPEEGVMSLRLSPDGLRLEAADENGRAWGWDSLLCALVRGELSGGRRCLCLAYDAPEAAEAVAHAQNGRLYRLGRDGDDALEVWRKKPYARDGLFLALRLCAWLHESGKRLADWMAELPEFYTSEAVVSVSGGGARLLKALGREYEAETVSGLKVRTERGCATVSSAAGGRLRILAESFAMETAAELAAELRDRVAALDAES